MLPLDCHAHVKADIALRDLEGLSACVVAVTRTIDEYVVAAARRDASTVWGLGSHPGVTEAHARFEINRFRELLADVAIVGEIGLDGRAKVALEVQRKTFDAILSVLAGSPRIASVHSVAATRDVVEMIAAHGVRGQILHWWRGTKNETRLALDCGCYFSLNSAEVNSPKVLEWLPKDRILTETDHPFGDRRECAPRRPGNMNTIEKALASHWGIGIVDVRRQIWRNFRDLAMETKTASLLPPAFQKSMLMA